jgi:hypothetical protein
MSFRPFQANWLEAVTIRKQLAQTIAVLARTGAVELESRGEDSCEPAVPNLDAALKDRRELARKYKMYWPAPRFSAFSEGPAFVLDRRSRSEGGGSRSRRRRCAGWNFGRPSCGPIRPRVTASRRTFLWCLPSLRYYQGHGMSSAIIRSISGPVLRATVTGPFRTGEAIEVGAQKLRGEVIRQRGYFRSAGL